MKKDLSRAGCAITAMLALASGAAAASGDPAAGGRKAIYCAYCHGADGNPLDAAAPRLAGQSAEALVAKMKRNAQTMGKHELMIQAYTTGRILNDRDMNDLAAYFAQQPARTAVQPVSANASAP
jgi:cytochrome c553